MHCNMVRLGQAQGEYREIAFFKGMIEGYNALDGPAGPVFAIIIIHAITAFQVKERKNVVKYTVISGIGAVSILSIIYYMLTYIGATTHTIFENGGALLHGVASDLLGPVWRASVGGICLPSLYDHFHWTYHVLCRLFPLSFCLLYLTAKSQQQYVCSASL